MEFLGRIAALFPPPRAQLVRFHDVFAPHSKHRARIVPGTPSSTEHIPNGGPQKPPPPASPTPQGKTLPTRAGHRLDWATLLRRTFAIDVLACERCGGRRQLGALITEEKTAHKILAHLGAIDPGAAVAGGKGAAGTRGKGRRPDVFHVGVAGAPVVDWRDYDTCYTERYLGLPSENKEGYDSSSLLTYAAGLRRPLLLIHGTSDDNVLFFHTLKLSYALFRAGRPHELLPLPGLTHMVPDPVVTERMWTRIATTLSAALKPEFPPPTTPAPVIVPH